MCMKQKFFLNIIFIYGVWKKIFVSYAYELNFNTDFFSYPIYKNNV